MPPCRTTIREPSINPASVSMPSEDDNLELDEDLTPNLAEAIVLMTTKLQQRGNINSAPSLKVKEPDTFDGTDPRKLNNFILLCNLYFQNNPTCYNDATKVTFALSYLRGLALEFFEPTLLDSDNTPEWLEDWSTFLDILKHNLVLLIHLQMPKTALITS